MPILPFDLPPGLNRDDTDYASIRYVDGANVRFEGNYAEIDGGFERFSFNALTGVCRNIFGWTDPAGVNIYVFGLHNGLAVDQNGSFAYITPDASVAASGTIEVVALPSVNQTFVVSGQTFTFKTTRSGTGEVTIGANVSACAANIVTAINTDIGAQVTASAVGAVVTVVADTAGWAGNLALTSSAPGLVLSGYGFLEGGGTYVAGAINGTGSDGYGSGSFGGGDWGQTSPGQYFAQTWSFGSRRGLLFANPRGQTVFAWDGNAANKASPLGNAPRVVNYLLTTFNGQLMALGCTDTGGTYNPLCIRTTDPGFTNAWFPGDATIAQNFYLNGNGRLVCGRNLGRYVAAWTDSETHFLQYDGTQWLAELAGPGGICGPNAAAVVGQTAYWITPDLNFMAYPAGGEPAVIKCPIREDFEQNAAPSQSTKISASTYRAKNEIRWDYADRRDNGGIEISRFIRYNYKTGAWSKGTYARTAYIDAGPGPNPLGVDFAGNIYVQEVKDENGGSLADGGQFSWFLKTSPLYIGNADRWTMVRKFWPDIARQVGVVNLKFYTRDYPQGEDTMRGPYVAAAGQSRVDIRLSGRLVAVEYCGSSAPAGGRIGKPSIDYQQTSGR